jgi:hypothetical protein
MRTLQVALLLLVLALISRTASPHIDPHFAAEHAANNAWLNRQVARDGTKCCDEHDVEVLIDPRWRQTPAGYEVLIGETWRPVPPGRIMRVNPDDPSPYPGEVLLFRTGSTVWCFTVPSLF